MGKSFFSRQYMVYALSTTLAMILVIAVFAQISTSHSVRMAYGKQLAQARDISAAYAEDPLCKDVFAYHPEERLLIVDPEGTVLLDSTMKEDSTVGTTLQSRAVSRVLGGSTIQEVRSFSPDNSELMVTTSVPVYREGHVIGAVLLHTSYQTLKDEMAYIYRLLAICLIVIVIVTFGATYSFSSSLSGSIKEFSDVTRKIANGDFTSRVQSIHEGELGELSGNLNYMAEELEKLEDYRRDFLANISHDIRSPLTSIRGFVQAILDGTIPPEKGRRYLDIVLDETDRLTKMTNDILLLSKMENRRIKLHMVSLDLLPLVYKVTEQFEQAIKEKHMELRLNLPAYPVAVEADPNYLQRVVANLIDNAVKFCRPGDAITIGIRTTHNKAEISIADNGPGIPKDDLPYVWDRFHKGDRSRGQDKNGVGLGLSIIKEIIRAHGESIHVYSSLGVGTRFIFTLPLS